LYEIIVSLIFFKIFLDIRFFAIIIKPHFREKADKAKPSARWGRKATDLGLAEIAGLPEGVTRFFCGGPEGIVRNIKHHVLNIKLFWQESGEPAKIF
jgi:hypothetical protein